MRSVTSPSQQQLLFPLLETLAEAGGNARTEEVYQRVAERLDLPASVVGATAVMGPAGEVNLFHRAVRWAQQKAKLLGLPEAPRRGRWKITGRGRRALRFFIKLLTQPGDVVADFFAGSCKTGEEAEALGCHWVATERVLEYLQGAAHRFIARPGFRSTLV
ncbi:MAG: hypothetical protein CVV05_00830 [Gammaproteobacteria bacterium HGW-Gammaproteobacteria-1]|jgi:hypothetical protein|nr:MAG: hypothetical protein CVV05_00830 [Gammaproteobacteria bacterium HGW-Gammaproteobacteria-1]